MWLILFLHPIMIRSRYAAKNFHDFFDRVPIARRDRHTELLLDLAEVADRFHLAAIETEDEAVLDSNDLQQPVVVRG